MGSGDLARSIRASMSVPGLFKPVRLDDHLLVDGGIVNNLPIDIVKQMGAEILIVVDVGTPPADEEELSSPLQITSQMLTILIASQSQRQKKLMAVDDVLITPELGSFSASAFSQSIKAIDIGESSARKSLAKLAAYSLSQQAYVDHRNLIQAKRQGQPFIEKIVVENQSRLSSKVLDTRLSNHAGKVLDTLRLEREITNIYGFDTYETVDYQLTTKEGINELHIRAKNKEWGPNYIRFGVNLEDDFRGDSSYNLAARFTRTEVNRLGGEIRVDAIIGDTPALSLELYQPLDYASRWFVNPKLAYENASSGVFQNNKQIALFRSEKSTASLAVGRYFGYW
jgi:NTE family protein